MAPASQHSEGESASAGFSLFDPFVLAFACWTLACNAVVFSGGTLETVAWVGVLAVLGGLAAERWLRSKTSPDAAGGNLPADAEAASGPSKLERGLVLVAAALIAGLAARQSEPLLIWLLGLPLVALLTIREGALPIVTSPPLEGHARRLALTVIAIGCAVLTLMAKRADPDDVFYANIAVTAADHPGAALLVGDTMHGIEGLALSLSLYRVQSYELLVGLIAWITPLEVLDLLHVVFPAIVAFLIPFALARLLRLLVPRAWIWAVAFAVLFLWCLGEPHRSYGNFGFVRLQQGKSVLLTLVLPLITAYAIEFARRPSLRGWVLLAAVQIVGVGASVTALWLAPTVAGIGLGIGLASRVASLRTLVVGLLASAHPVGAALALRATTRADFEGLGIDTAVATPLPAAALAAFVALLAIGFGIAARGGRPARIAGTFGYVVVLGLVAAVASVPSDDLGALFTRIGITEAGRAIAFDGFEKALGTSRFATLFLFLVLGGWAFARGALLRRVLAFHALVLFLVFWNPLTAEVFSAQVIGEPTYWRVFWLLPAASSMGALLAMPIEWTSLGPLFVRYGVALVVALVLLVGQPERSTLSRENQVTFGAPGWRIPAEELETVEALVEHSPPGSHVLAPYRISQWIPAFHQHPYPLVVRRLYLDMLKGAIDKEEFDQRTQFTSIVSKAIRVTDRRVRGAIEAFDLKTICMTEAAWQPAFERALTAAGMEQVFENKRYRVWARP